MVTQTLQDIITPTNYNGHSLTQQTLHWRGDRKGIEEFNPTFTALQSADAELTTNEMAEFKGMLSSIFFPPNFYRTFSNTLPTPVPLPGHYGRVTNNVALPFPPGIRLPRLDSVRRQLHHLPRLQHGARRERFFQRHLSGAKWHGRQFSVFTTPQPHGKNRHEWLRTNGRSGFGFMHDGRVDTLTRFLIDGFPLFPEVGGTDQADMVAFLLSLRGSDLGTKPGNPSQDVPAATGRQITFSSMVPPPFLTDAFNLAMRTNSHVELVLRGKRNG